MNPNDFRRIALRMQDAIEGQHMSHPDFRAGGRIFATLHPDGKQGMVKLSPEQQQLFLRDYPMTFTPASGAWGRQGCTMVKLSDVDDETLGEAMTLAWQGVTSATVKGKKHKTQARKKTTSSRARRAKPRARG